MNTIYPAPCLAVTVTTKIRHLQANPDSFYPGMRVPRVSVSRGFNYCGPLFVEWS